MSDSNELQQLARLVEINRKRLEEVQLQIERIETVQLEHDDTRRALDSLSKGANGHLPLGAGVMIPIPKSSTTLVDLGSGIFGERNPEDAALLVQSRLDDLTELKSQFEADAAVINQRIEELSLSFEKAASNISKQTSANEEITEHKSEPRDQPPRKRRKFGGELTLDD